MAVMGGAGGLRWGDAGAHCALSRWASLGLLLSSPPAQPIPSMNLAAILLALASQAAPQSLSQSTLAKDQSAPAKDQSASAKDRSTSDGDQSVPSEDQPAIQQDQTVPGQDQSATQQDQTALGQDQSAPGEDQSAPEEELYRCGEFLFNESDANDYHSRLLRWWKIPKDGFVAYSTCSRKTTLLALQWMASTRSDLERIFGKAPADPATVILLRSQVQYNAFAATTPEEFGIPPESRGYSAFHYAFPCDQWIDIEAGDDYPGAACAYWDASTEAGNGWGPLAVRFAAALAFTEAIDPSPKAIEKYQADLAAFPSEAFWSEKQIPLWLRFGAASYAERFFIEHRVQNPHWAREWSIGELAAGGGSDDLATIFTFALDRKQFQRSRRLT